MPVLRGACPLYPQRFSSNRYFHTSATDLTATWPRPLGDNIKSARFSSSICATDRVRLTLNLESTYFLGLDRLDLYPRTWERTFDVNMKELTFRASLLKLLEDGLRHIVILVCSAVLELDLKSLGGRIVTNRYNR